MSKKKADEVAVLDIQEIQMQDVRFNIVGTSPMIMNRFSQKAWHELLLPARKQNRAGLEQTLKHEPFSEFRGAIYLNRDPKKALIHVPNGAFHGALAAVAIDIPGAKKAQIERLTKLVDINIDLFGVPNIFCAMVRNSDMARTPDVRTRPIFPQWACSLTVRYVKAILTERTVAHLLGAAGMIIGIGDWRGQKGGPYGSFRLAADDDAEFNLIVKQQGRAAQQKALDRPIFFDADTEELLTWFEAEVKRREMEPKAEKRKPPRQRVIVERPAGNGGEYVGVEA